MPVQVLVLSTSVICKYTSPTRCKLCIKGKNSCYIVLTITFYESCFLDMGQKKKNLSIPNCEKMIGKYVHVYILKIKQFYFLNYDVFTIPEEESIIYG